MRTSLWLLNMTALAQMCAAFSISGNAGVGSATLQLTGAASQSTTSGPKGHFSFAKLKKGQYVVTPSLSGYTFSPSSQAITLTDANVSSVNFTATAVPPTETSLVATPASFSLTSTGATRQLQVEASYSNGSSQNVTANSTFATNNSSVATVSQSGLIAAVGNGSTTVSASYSGLSSSVSVTVNIPVVTYSIAGSAGIASATVTLSGASSATTTASSSGTYGFGGLLPGSYTITPDLSGYTFNPASQSATVTNANVSVNFTATAVTHSVDLSWSAGTIQNPAPGQVVIGYNVYRSSVSGGPYTQLNSSPLGGLTYSDTAVSAGQTWYYVCTTEDNLSNVSAYSNQAAATLP